MQSVHSPCRTTGLAVSKVRDADYRSTELRFVNWEDDGRSVTLQFDVRNVTDRLNVINFSGLFSGTALAPGRQYLVQTRVGF